MTVDWTSTVNLVLETAIEVFGTEHVLGITTADKEVAPLLLGVWTIHLSLDEAVQATSLVTVLHDALAGLGVYVAVHEYMVNMTPHKDESSGMEGTVSVLNLTMTSSRPTSVLN